MQIAIIVSLVFLVFAVVFLFWQNNRLHRRFSQMAKIDSGNFEQLLQKVLQSLEEGQKSGEEQEKKLADLTASGQLKIGRVGVFHFNPFANLGGSQSFTAALLNDNNDGLLLTSLHGRGGTRLYIKTVRGGQAESVNLSIEEKKAILKAQKELE